MNQGKDERQLYDFIYSQHRAGKTVCRASCHVLEKARRKVDGVIDAFGIDSIKRARVLDVGCGLGYYAEALRERGARVTAVDTSPIAIEMVRAAFPLVDSRVASFPQEVDETQRFDLIWACDFSLLNTFDVDFISREFVRHCLSRLTENGALVIGWHSNFSGTMGDENLAHWPWRMIRNMKDQAGLSGPRVVNVPLPFLSHGIIQAGRILKKSIPIFFFRRRIQVEKTPVA